MSCQSELFQPAEGIDPTVFTQDIRRYLGPGASVRPGEGVGEFEGIPGYWITADYNLASEMVQHLKLDNKGWPVQMPDGSPFDTNINRISGPEAKVTTPSYTAPTFGTPYGSKFNYGMNDNFVDWLFNDSKSGPDDPYDRRRFPPASLSLDRQEPIEPDHINESLLQQDGQNQYNMMSLPDIEQHGNHEDYSSRRNSPSSTKFLSELLISNSAFMTDQLLRCFESFSSCSHSLSADIEDIGSICGWQIGQEKFLADSIPDTPLEPTGRHKLGHGSTGEVYEVRNPAGNFESFVQKKVAISPLRRLAVQQLKLVQDEITHMKKLTHPHIVRIIGSYQEECGTRNHVYCILMYPVGDNDLSMFLEEDCQCIKHGKDYWTANQYMSWIRKWFGCLASALAYMHAQRVHHEDIKPRNIVHRGEHIYFTDFSSARRFEVGQATSTANPACATKLFAAPEALPNDDGDVDRHGSKSDVFSLGLVFVEMLTVLDGRDIEGLHDYLDEHSKFGEPYTRQYHRVLNWIDLWTAAGDEAFMYEKCIRPMLSRTRPERPSADEVVTSIQRHRPWNKMLACSCQE